MKVRHVLMIIAVWVSVAAAIVTTAPTTAPTTNPQPTTNNPHGIVCGLGTTATTLPTGGTYHVGAAPAVGWFDARPAPFSIRTDTAVWNFGDGNETYPDPKHADDSKTYPTAVEGANNSLTGPIVAHWFLNPGTYHVTCTITHPTTGPPTAGPPLVTTYALTAVVTADTRRQVYFSASGNDAAAGTAAAPWKSAAKFYAAVDAGNVNVHLAHAWTGTLPGTAIVGSNTVIQGDGSPVLTPAPGDPVLCGAGDNSTANVLVWGVTFDSPGTAGAPVGTGAAALPTTIATGGCHVATVRGTGWAFVDCRLGCLDRGWDVEGVDGLLVQGCAQTKTYGIDSQVFYADAGSRITVTFSQFTSSVKEDPFRVTSLVDGTGGVAGLDLEWCTFAQPVEAKAPITLRAGSDFFERNCVTLRGEHSINVGIGDATGSIGSVRVTNTVTRDCLLDAQTVESTFRVDDGVIGCTLANLDCRVAPGGAAVTVSPNWGPPASVATLSDLVVSNVTVTGTRAAGVLVTGAITASPADGAVTQTTGWPTLTVSGVTIK